MRIKLIQHAQLFIRIQNAVKHKNFTCDKKTTLGASVIVIKICGVLGATWLNLPWMVIDIVSYFDTLLIDYCIVQY